MKKFNGRIRFYWQGVGSKPDRILEIHDEEAYAALSIYYGILILEGYDKWQRNPDFDAIYQDIYAKAENYAARLKRLLRLGENWDWDWCLDGECAAAV